MPLLPLLAMLQGVQHKPRLIIRETGSWWYSTKSVDSLVEKTAMVGKRVVNETVISQLPRKRA